MRPIIVFSNYARAFAANTTSYSREMSSYHIVVKRKAVLHGPQNLVYGGVAGVIFHGRFPKCTLPIDPPDPPPALPRQVIRNFSDGFRKPAELLQCSAPNLLRGIYSSAVSATPTKCVCSFAFFRERAEDRDTHDSLRLGHPWWRRHDKYHVPVRPITAGAAGSCPGVRYVRRKG